MRGLDFIPALKPGIPERNSTLISTGWLPTALARGLFTSIDLTTFSPKDSPGCLNQPLPLLLNSQPLLLKIEYHGPLSFFKYMIRSFFKSRSTVSHHLTLILSDRPLELRYPTPIPSQSPGGSRPR